MSGQPLRLTDLLPDLADPESGTVAQAAAHRTDPAVEAARKLEEAHAAGYAAGVAAERARIDADKVALAEHLGAALQRVAADAAESAAATVAADAADMAATAWHLARWVLGRELATDPAALTSAISAALTEVDATATVDVYAHPDTLTVLTEFADGHAPHTLSLRPDPALAVGELRAVADTGARVEATLDEIGRRALARLVGTIAAAQEEHR